MVFPAVLLFLAPQASADVEAAAGGSPAAAQASVTANSVTASAPDADAEPAAPPAGDDPLLDVEFDEEFDAALDLDPAPDPFEPINRRFFGFNQVLDEFFWKPVVRSYRFLVPEPGRGAVRRVFQNAGAAPVLVNDLLQLRFDDAGETLGRFVLNTTVGFGGVFDAGIEAGWEYHDSDFGETLALYGVPSGPYLVIPIFGPSTLRDGFGDVVDRLFEPLTYVLGIGFVGSSIQVMIGTGTGITTYEAHIDDLERLEDASIDFYAAMRSAYMQDRQAEIREVIDDSWLNARRSRPLASN
jgi:phospholipid-binding lipoprotein MlaA